VSGYFNVRDLKASHDRLDAGQLVEAQGAYAKNRVVYPSGQNGPFVQVTVADADTLAASKLQPMLIVIASNASGDKTVARDHYLVDNFATTAGAVGDIVYAAASAGGMTITQPVPGKQSVPVGIIVAVAAAAAGTYTVLFNPSMARAHADRKAQQNAAATIFWSDNVDVVVLKGAAGTGDLSATVLRKTKFLPIQCIMVGAGAGGDTAKLTDGTTDITDNVDVSGKADKELFQFATWNDATATIAAGGAIHLVTASDALAEVHLLAIPVV